MTISNINIVSVREKVIVQNRIIGLNSLSVHLERMLRSSIFALFIPDAIQIAQVHLLRFVNEPKKKETVENSQTSKLNKANFIISY